MEFVSGNILILHSDTIDVVRKTFNLDKPGVIDEAIDIIEEWLKKQDHFIKKDFSRRYLEAVIIRSKGSVERSKKCLDKLFTARALLPKFVVSVNIKKDMFELNSEVHYAFLPKLTKNHCRVYLAKNSIRRYNTKLFDDYYTLFSYFLEYAAVKDYNLGNILISDFRNTDIMEIIKHIDLMELGKVTKVAFSGYGIRVKSMHLISSSKFVNIFMSTMKQFLPEKIAKRVFVHENLETLYEHVERDILPIDYGGKELSLMELSSLWREELSSDNFIDYMKEMSTAKIDESLRKKEQLIDELFGVYGTFRNLNVD